jgi:osmoprotectant transport system ATP-binding protein
VIKLENVTKIYPGMTEPAVTGVSLEIPEGETCVLIGPSGCGKTTTMKMVNRLIEPTSGRIFVAGQNVMEQDPVQLRRNIGYVIQQIGLFPHMTIRDNIATVPQMLGWEKSRIDHRVDELLELMGLDPAFHRDRYPRQLSGGQRQRIGVARALAADPPVMLMDEPFGAIDPITREHLQNEFLRLQKQIKKTIMFVTHDIDEAIKMGTRICILQVGGVVEQYGPPDEILARPANAFVAGFVGADRGLKRLGLVRTVDVMRKDGAGVARFSPASSTGEIVARLTDMERRTAWVVDDEGRFVGYVSLDDARTSPDTTAGQVARPYPAVTVPEATVKDAYSIMLTQGLSRMPVLGPDNELLGIIFSDDVHAVIRSQQED